MRESTAPDPAALSTEPGGATTDVAVTEVTATLLIGDFTTLCSNCKKPTLLHGVSRHTNISGWNPVPGGGCGARFLNTDALDRPISAARLKELRPDLPVRGHGIANT